MKIKNQKASKRKPRSVSSRVIATIRNSANQKIINIEDLRAEKEIAEELQQTVVSEEELKTLDPAHAIYVYGQNKLSVIVEQLLDLPALEKLADAYEEARDEYMPSDPPMSPVRLSYYCLDIMQEFFLSDYRQGFHVKGMGEKVIGH